MTDFKEGDLVRPTRQALIKNPTNRTFDYTQQVQEPFLRPTVLVDTMGVNKVKLSWDPEDLEIAFRQRDLLKPSESYLSYVPTEKTNRYFFWGIKKREDDEPLIQVMDNKGNFREFHWHNLELDSRELDSKEPLKFKKETASKEIIVKEFNTWLKPKNKVELGKQESVKPNVPGQLKLFD